MARPQQYDRQAVLQAAQQLFWNKGYQATSVADLQQATGLKPGSLYQAFGNKEGLLQEVLDYYGSSSLAFIDQLQADSDNVSAVLRGFLRAQIRRSCGDCPQGCLLVNSLLEFHGCEPELETGVKQQLQRIQQRFETLIEQGRQRGEFPAAINSAQQATALMAAVWGIGVSGRMQPDPVYLQQFADHVLAGISAQPAAA